MPLSPAQEKFSEHMQKFARVHQEIVEQFVRSVEKAEHWVKLACLSREKEPQATLDMLRQIMEIDLLGNLSGQKEEFEKIYTVLPEKARFVYKNVENLALNYKELIQRTESLHQEMYQLVQELEGGKD